MGTIHTYIDLGAHNGGSVIKFLHQYPTIRVVYAFEPVDYTAEWDLIEHDYPTVEFHWIRKAVGVIDGPVTFTIADFGSESHTIHPDCYHFTRGKRTQIECLDFEKWLRELTKIGAIIVKLDVEGAEYGILDSLINTGTIHDIDILYCEFHDWIMPNSFAELHNGIVQRCPIEIHGWG